MKKNVALLLAGGIIVLLLLGESPAAIGRGIAHSVVYTAIRHQVNSFLNHR